MAFTHALLAATEKLKVIAAVLPGPWHPALLAKQVATISHLTNARIAVNIVSGWFRGEFHAIGEPWLDHDERYRRSEEFIRALRGIWSEDNFTLTGDFYRFRDYSLKPKPLGPLPEIFQGGSSRAARDMASRVSDWYFTNGNSVAEIKKQIDDIRTKAARNGHSVKIGVNAFAIARPSEAEARQVLAEILENADPDAVRAFHHEVQNAGNASPEREGNWAKSTLEDLVQYNDGFRTNLIGTPDADRRTHPRPQGGRRRSRAARLPAFPGGGRIFRQARHPLGQKTRSRTRKRPKSRMSRARDDVMTGSPIVCSPDAPAPRYGEASATGVLAFQASAKASPAAALALEGVCLSFGGVKALTDIDLSVGSGEIRAIIGPNGAGKSSLINIISGLYKPDKGRVWLEGKSFSSVPTDRLARLGVARTFQNIALFKGLSAADNIAAGRVSTVRSNALEQVLGFGRAKREREATETHVEELIEFLGLGPVRDRLAGSLPYGLQKRVELARALAVEPRLLLLDEPMAGMTALEKQEMSAFVREARRRYGTTIILIEHDIGVVMGLSDRVAVLDYGLKIADGAPSQVINDPAVIDAYLGVAHELDQEGAA